MAIYNIIFTPLFWDVVVTITSFVIAYCALQIGKHMGYSKLWKAITAGFILLGIGRSIRIIVDYNRASTIDIFTSFGSFIVELGLLLIFYGKYSLHNVVKEVT